MVKKSVAGRPATSHSSKQHRSQNPGAEDMAGNTKKVHGRKIHGKKIAKGAKELAVAIGMPRAGAGGTKPSKGCFPRAFMLFLPLLLIGAYLFIKS